MRPNTGVLCHECHTVLPTQQQQQRQVRVSGDQPIISFFSPLSPACQPDALKIGLSLSFSSRPTCKLLFQLSTPRGFVPPIIVTG